MLWTWAWGERGRGGWPGALAHLAAAPVVFIGLAGTAAAEDGPPQFQAWSGVQAEQSSAFGYAGLVYAPFSGIMQDGLRLRAGGGQGHFTYTSTSSAPGLLEISHSGQVSQAEILLGTQMTLGATTVKVYAGIVSTWRTVKPADPAVPSGQVTGAKLVVETWSEIDDDWFAAVDGYWASQGPSQGVSARIGWRMLDWLAVGPEAGWTQDGAYQAGRLGAFAFIDSPAGEVTLNVGAIHQLDEATGIYAGASLLTQF